MFRSQFPHKVIIIFAGDGKSFMAYSMCSKVAYNRLRIPLRIISFDRKEFDSQIRELIINGEQTGLVLNLDCII